MLEEDDEEDDDFLPSILCKDISEYLRNGKCDRLEIYIGEIYGSSCLNGRVYIAAPPLL
jgi:hypothetical protein